MPLDKAADRSIMMVAAHALDRGENDKIRTRKKTMKKTMKVYLDDDLLETTTVYAPTTEDEWNLIPAKTRKKIIEKMRDVNVDHDWWDWIFDALKNGYSDILSEHSDFRFFGIDEIYFSGFWCQGNGAIFEGAFDAMRFLQETNFETRLKWGKIEFEEKKIGFSHKGNYYHSNSYSMDYNLRLYAKNGEELDCKYIDALHKSLIDYVQYLYRKLCRRIYSRLEAEYEFLTSEAAICETIFVNEYVFDENGKQIY